MSDQKDELLPCPFCGEQPDYVLDEVRCKNHGGWGRLHLSPEEWNRRTPPPADVKEPGSEEKADSSFEVAKALTLDFNGHTFDERGEASVWLISHIQKALSEAYQRGKEEGGKP